mmetsp:Transcript_14329/g.12963  ORF Transcript_14329/g.12963 Transcript_14329/m.12963 type:complete len:106 (+) Transcript_14329:253-570(+)
MERLAMAETFISITYLLSLSGLEYSKSLTTQDINPIDISEAWSIGTKVLTIYGSGIIHSFRSLDAMYAVQLAFGLAYLKANSIIGAEELSNQALLTGLLLVILHY